jgi:hypothetical protein
MDMAQMAATVGSNAVNLPGDVRAVQMLLNRFQPDAKPLLAVDGRIGPQTNHPIEAYIDNRILVCAERVVRPASPKLEALNGGTIDRIAWRGEVDAAFEVVVTRISQELQPSVDFLMVAMACESAGTVNPSVLNAAGSGAVGLIQFMPSTARDLGTTTGAHLPRGRRLSTSPTSGSTSHPITAGCALWRMSTWQSSIPQRSAKGASHILFASGTTAYKQVAALDSNEDGSVAVGEAAARWGSSTGEAWGSAFWLYAGG